MSRRLKILIIAAVTFVFWVVTAPVLATWLIVERPLEKADAIIVLSGSAVYKERTHKAAELYKKGLSSHIFITNDGGRAGWSRNEKTNLPFFELEKRELIANGVAEDAITILPGAVSGTDDEAKALAAEIEEHPIKSLLIITSAYHTRRTLRTFDKILAGKHLEIGIEHPPTGEQTPDPAFWWLTAKGWPMIAGEYVKLAGYWMFY